MSFLEQTSRTASKVQEQQDREKKVLDQREQALAARESLDSQHEAELTRRENVVAEREREVQDLAGKLVQMEQFELARARDGQKRLRGAPEVPQAIQAPPLPMLAQDPAPQTAPAAPAAPAA